RQDGRLHRAIAANDFQRVAHVIEELATEGAVHTVVQVVPPAAVAARPPHYAADRGDGRCNDEAPGFRQHLQAFRQTGQGLANGLAEGVDVRYGTVVGHGESTADVQQADVVPRLAGSVNQSAAGVDGRNVLARVHRL